MKTAKKHVGHGISQFDLTQNLINNLQQFDLSPSAKLVLIYLSTCYNPKHADIFPKQSTIAEKLGLSEASVIRAISEAHKQGLIISERKYTNRYKITSKFLNLCGLFKQTNKMQDENLQIETKETCKLQPSLIEPKREQKNEPLKVEDYKILKAYAIRYGAKNVQKYINKLISSGSAKEIIEDEKKIKRKAEFMCNETKRIQREMEALKDVPQVDVNFFANVRKNLII